MNADNDGSSLQENPNTGPQMLRVALATNILQQLHIHLVLDHIGNERFQIIDE